MDGYNEPIEPARQILDVEKIDVVADKGYFKSEDIAACEKAGLTPHVPSHNVEPQWRTAFFARTSFATTPRKTPTFVASQGEWRPWPDE
jgi:hypothetical protein